MIKLKIDNKEVTFKYNSSMRLKDFIKFNALDEAGGATIFQMCYDAFVNDSFRSIDLRQVSRVKEEVVSRKGQFNKKLTVTAFQGLKPADEHLFDAYVDKLNKRHSASVEKVAIWRASQERRLQDAGQTKVTA